MCSINKSIDQLAARQKQIEDSIPYTLINEEMTTPRPAHVLIRGDFQKRGEKVERDVPAIFPPLPPDAPRNRLGLAQWLVRPEPPLTSRVVVNRLWAQMFGTGLVKTIGDFGTQGELPSHPELLDWLATEYSASGWDTKAMLKQMALSATYRQSSALPVKVPDVDPNNRLLYRSRSWPRSIGFAAGRRGRRQAGKRRGWNALTAEGQERHLPLHGRRAVARRSVRPQAETQGIAWPGDAEVRPG
jgi:hypothetical protein